MRCRPPKMKPAHTLTKGTGEGRLPVDWRTHLDTPLSSASTCCAPEPFVAPRRHTGVLCSFSWARLIPNLEADMNTKKLTFVSLLGAVAHDGWCLRAELGPAQTNLVSYEGTHR